MNRFRLVLGFVFMFAAALMLVASLLLQAFASPSPEELQLTGVLREDGIYLAMLFALLGAGWVYFGRIFPSEVKPA